MSKGKSKEQEQEEEAPHNRIEFRLSAAPKGPPEKKPA
jgi:hypothetical protein